VPELILAGERVARARTPLPCSRRGERHGGVVWAVLAQAGLERLRSRAGAFAAEPAARTPRLQLCLKVARALGYVANADAAEELGRRLAACGLTNSLPSSEPEYRRALAVGLAGLLPSQRTDGAGGVESLAQWEGWWRGLVPALSPMEPRAWRLSGLYPNNSPVRRVIALADLWPSIPAAGDAAIKLVNECCAEPRRCAADVEALFRRAGEGYWRHHYDFGLATRESDLVGGSKAREVVVNAVLPWVASLARVANDVPLGAAIARLSLGYPSAAENAVTRHMRRQLNLDRAALTAAEQQGMVHLFREYCRSGRCDDCPLGGLWARRARRRAALFQCAGIADVTCP